MQWLGTVKQQAITWTSVEQDLCRHIALLGHSELNGIYKRLFWHLLTELLLTIIW